MRLPPQRSQRQRRRLLNGPRLLGPSHLDRSSSRTNVDFVPACVMRADGRILTLEGSLVERAAVALDPEVLKVPDIKQKARHVRHPLSREQRCPVKAISEETTALEPPDVD